MYSSSSLSKAASSLWLAAGLSAFSQGEPAYTELVSPDNQARGGFGYDFGGLPDLNGDGFGEFYATQFKTYVYDGKSLAFLYSFGEPCTYGHVESAGDLNGDGIPDLMAPRLCDASGMGPVEFINGKTGESLFAVDSPAPV